MHENCVKPLPQPIPFREPKTMKSIDSMDVSPCGSGVPRRFVAWSPLPPPAEKNQKIRSASCPILAASASHLPIGSNEFMAA